MGNFTSRRDFVRDFLFNYNGWTIFGVVGMKAALEVYAMTNETFLDYGNAAREALAKLAKLREESK